MPPNEVHPDGLWITLFSGKLYLILFSCKCCTTELNIRDSHSSTLIDRLFMDNYRIDNPLHTSNKRERFAELFLGKASNSQAASDGIVGGYVRIHIHAAPRFGRFTLPRDYDLKTDVNVPDMVSVDVDIPNLDRVIREEWVVDLIKRVCLSNEKQIE